MNWSLSEALRKPVRLLKPTSNTVQEASPPNGVVNDTDDDLGVNRFQTKREVPFKRLESTVRNYVEIALPVDVERLHKHKVNIIKWRTSEQFSKLKIEYENSSQTVRQITRTLADMDNLRARVLAEDLDTFDLYLNPAKTKAMQTVEDFLTLKQGLESMDKSLLTDNFIVRQNRQFSSVEDSRHVTMQGNQLLIQSTCDDSESTSTNNEHFVEAPIQDQLVREELNDLGYSWKKLEKDMTDLHEMMQTVSSMVHDQRETVNDITSNVERAGDNIEAGTSQLRRATVLKAAMFPIVGAVVGGPVGMLVGLKLGGLAVAAAGVTGSVVGYQGGKVLKKRQQEANSIEMKSIRKDDDSDSSNSTGSFEFLHHDHNGT